MRTTTGHAGLIRVNMVGRCGGAVVASLKMHLAANFINISIRMMRIKIYRILKIVIIKIKFVAL